MKVKNNKLKIFKDFTDKNWLNFNLCMNMHITVTFKAQAFIQIWKVQINRSEEYEVLYIER